MPIASSLRRSMAFVGAAAGESRWFRAIARSTRQRAAYREPYRRTGTGTRRVGPSYAHTNETLGCRHVRLRHAQPVRSTSSRLHPAAASSPRRVVIARRAPGSPLQTARSPSAPGFGVHSRKSYRLLFIDVCIYIALDRSPKPDTIRRLAHAERPSHETLPRSRRPGFDPRRRR